MGGRSPATALALLPPDSPGAKNYFVKAEFEYAKTKLFFAKAYLGQIVSGG